MAGIEPETSQSWTSIASHKITIMAHALQFLLHLVVKVLLDILVYCKLNTKLLKLSRWVFNLNYSNWTLSLKVSKSINEMNDIAKDSLISWQKMNSTIEDSSQLEGIRSSLEASWSEDQYLTQIWSFLNRKPLKFIFLFKLLKSRLVGLIKHRYAH